MTPWMVKHAADILSRCNRGKDGRTPRERLRGRRMGPKQCGFGERVMYLVPKTKGKYKADSRVKEGIWLGIKEKSGESIIGTARGVVKARTIRRRPEGERWSWEELQTMKGVPWRPNPNDEADGGEVPAGIPEEEEAWSPP